MPKIEVYKSRSLLRSEKWRWRLRSDNGNIIAESGEGYTGKGDCIGMALKVTKGDYKAAPVIVTG